MMPSGAGVPAAGMLRVVVTSLEMLACPAPARVAPRVPDGCSVERAHEPEVGFYRFLYDTVGEPWLWVDRRRWSDAAVAERVQDPDVEIWVLTAEGRPAGFAELDGRSRGQVELSYFGLLPAFIGRGLGRGLLRFAVHRAWSSDPQRLWVHTCDLDHPAALGLYRGEGFVPFKVETVTMPDPRISGLIPRDAAPHRPISGG